MKRKPYTVQEKGSRADFSLPNIFVLPHQEFLTPKTTLSSPGYKQERRKSGKGNSINDKM